MAPTVGAPTAVAECDVTQFNGLLPDLASAIAKLDPTALLPTTTAATSSAAPAHATTLRVAGGNPLSGLQRPGGPLSLQPSPATAAASRPSACVWMNQPNQPSTHAPSQPRATALRQQSSSSALIPAASQSSGHSHNSSSAAHTTTTTTTNRQHSSLPPGVQHLSACHASDLLTPGHGGSGGGGSDSSEPPQREPNPAPQTTGKVNAGAVPLQPHPQGGERELFAPYNNDRSLIPRAAAAQASAAASAASATTHQPGGGGGHKGGGGGKHQPDKLQPPRAAPHSLALVSAVPRGGGEMEIGEGGGVGGGEEGALMVHDYEELAAIRSLAGVKRQASVGSVGSLPQSQPQSQLQQLTKRQRVGEGGGGGGKAAAALPPPPPASATTAELRVAPFVHKLSLMLGICAHRGHTQPQAAKQPQPSTLTSHPLPLRSPVTLDAGGLPGGVSPIYWDSSGVSFWIADPMQLENYILPQ